MADARKPKKHRPQGPYLDAALICDQVIREHDGTYSAVRLVNRLTIHDVAPPAGSILVSPVSLFISFKAGDFHGTQDLLIFVEDPLGNRYQPYHPTPMTFRGEDTGEVAKCPLRLRYEKDGIYWIDIVLNGKYFSSIPLSLKYDQQPSK